MAGLCVVGVAHGADERVRCRGSATVTSEQLNERERNWHRASDANELISTRHEGWNEAKRRGRTLLLLVYRTGRVALAEITRKVDNDGPRG